MARLICPARAKTSSISLSWGKTFSTSPMRSASDASIILPVRIISIARPTPTSFGRLRAPPDSGTNSAGTATSRTRARSHAQRISLAVARSRPIACGRGDRGQLFEPAARYGTDLANFSLLLERPLQLALARLLCLEPRVLDGDDRLVGERFEQIDLSVSEEANLGASDDTHANSLARGDQGNGEYRAEAKSSGEVDPP